MPHTPKPETIEVQPAEAVDPAANCSALRVAELVDQARLALADALTIIEAKRTYSGKNWNPKMRTRAEGEGKYGLRNALVELRAKAQWLAEDARKPNGGWPWPNTEVCRPARQETQTKESDVK